MGCLGVDPCFPRDVGCCALRSFSRRGLMFVGAGSRFEVTFESCAKSGGE